MIKYLFDLFTFSFWKNTNWGIVVTFRQNFGGFVFLLLFCLLILTTNRTCKHSLLIMSLNVGTDIHPAEEHTNILYFAVIAQI